MSTTQLNAIPSPPEGQDLATVPMKFEVTPIPVTDFDRAKAFYQRLGWRLDIDLQFTEQVRGVQFTPPGSPASIQFGPAGAERLQRLLLIVEDIEAARTELVDRGIEVSEIFHALPGEAPAAGARPARALLRQPRHLLRPRRQPVGPAGGHRADPGARVSDDRRGSRCAAARNG